MSLLQLIAPAPTRQRVEDDGVDVAPVIETGIEVQGDVVGIVTNVDGEAATEAENTEMRGRVSCHLVDSCAGGARAVMITTAALTRM